MASLASAITRIERLLGQAAMPAQSGAMIGGAAGAALGMVAAVILAILRGMIPDVGTSVAVGLMGVFCLGLACLIFGAVIGAAVAAGKTWIGVWLSQSKTDKKWPD